jgi:hypothetical protein
MFSAAGCHWPSRVVLTSTVPFMEVILVSSAEAYPGSKSIRNKANGFLFIASRV